MKRILLSISFILSGVLLFAQEEQVKDSFYTLSPVEIRAVRAGELAPFTKTNISKNEINKANLGQDIPFLLNQTPGVVINSDAGNGFGYTGIRIRGTDATRINVTLNGIPYNDAESQGTFFVDLPDFLSSTGSIQVQRGVGTSSNGAGAFGASINLSSNEINTKPYAELNNSIGSFNTWKNTVKLGTGLQKGFAVDFRLSRISSDGFIDRATSRLSSIYLSTAYLFGKSSLRLNIFSGKEKTYQAWYGVSEADLKAGKRSINYAGTEKPGTPYPDEIDDYKQTHYQLFYNTPINPRLSFNTALFLTRGKGFYEQYKQSAAFSDYGLPDLINGPDTITNSDLVRQLWLDNYFYGNIFSFQYKNAKTEATLGGSYTRYDGYHNGKVVWAEKGLPGIKKYYDHDALKSDLTVYFKQQTRFANNWYWFYDFQLRHIKYEIDGFRNAPTIKVNNEFTFFNPKIGITYAEKGRKAFLSIAVANKEPNRDDFETASYQQPKPERLFDTELGFEVFKPNYNWSTVVYYMHYKDQLILTGKINDVGAYTRTNIPKSYRAGIELQGSVKPAAWFSIAANLALSKNKIDVFTEYIDDYDNGGQQSKVFNSTGIAFSPSVVSGATINFYPCKNTELGLINKYVSRQYLDNTENKSRSLDPFFVQDLRVIQKIKIKKLKELSLTAQINNLLNAKYEPNGYTYSYIWGGLVTENFYFPMAGRNFLLALNLRF